MDDTGEDQLGADAPWPEDVYLPPRRRQLGMWIVAFSLFLSVGLLGWAAEKRFHVVALATRRLAVQPQGAVSPQVDARVEALLADGERALSEGNLDGAQGDFDKASVLTERDPRVLLGEARVAAAKADVPWLKARLLLPDATEEARVTRAQLDERIAGARQTADDALSAAPQDPRALCAKLDALRLAGDTQAATGYVVAVFAQASQPDTAYALGMLDLVQPASPWATLVDRLRLAARAETGAGRAGAALVYALARSGDVAAAEAELAKLDAQPRPYPLLPNLHAWMARARTRAAEAPAEPSAPASAPSHTETSGPLQAQTPGVGTATPAGESIRPNPPGVPTTLEAAAQAERRGDLVRAERIYQGILATDPNESQALAGLGNVLRLRGDDPWGAIDAYQHAIRINPSYLPAQLGLADTQWARGDHAGAAQSYKRIVDRFPAGMYPEYVNQRLSP